MKKLLALLTLAAFSASAQIQLLDGTTPHTNSTTTSANINVPSKGWTNVPYATTNYIYITFGDGLPSSATTKLNSDLVYLTNQLALALQLPNQINTNWQSAVAVQSNRINVVIVNVAAISNLLTTTMATVAAFPGANINNGSVNSNKLDAGTLAWLQTCFVPGSLMNFAGGISSDGSGNITGTSFKGSLLDSASSSGAATYVPTANGDGTWTWGAPASGGGSIGVTNFSLTASSVASTSAPTAVVLGVTNNIAYVAFGIPAGATGATGAAGTNTVNYYNLSNAIVSSDTYTLTNRTFTFALSNYLGVFTNAYQIKVVAPQIDNGALAPPSSATYAVAYSTNGTSWLWITNNSSFSQLPVAAPNVVWLAVTNSATGAGNVTITGVNHGEALGRTNDLSGQTLFVNNAIDLRSPPTLQQMQNAIGNAISGWQSSGTNYYFAPGGIRTIEVSSPAAIYSTNLSIAIDGTGTNFAISLPTTNFVSGWQFQVSTNLVLVNGFQTFTNYTLATNSGVATFTVSMAAVSQAMAFFRIVTLPLGSVQVDYPLTFNLTTNQIVWGGTNSAPANTTTPVAWISVQVTGRTNAYRLPIYQ